MSDDDLPQRLVRGRLDGLVPTTATSRSPDTTPAWTARIEHNAVFAIAWTSGPELSHRCSCGDRWPHDDPDPGGMPVDKTAAGSPVRSRDA